MNKRITLPHTTLEQIDTILNFLEYTPSALACLKGQIIDNHDPSFKEKKQTY